MLANLVKMDIRNFISKRFGKDKTVVQQVGDQRGKKKNSFAWVCQMAEQASKSGEGFWRPLVR